MLVAFDHEKLEVYQAAIAFVAWADEVTGHREISGSMKTQLERAAASMPLNIAEGNGKYSARDRCRFLEVARGSALECAACLDVLVARKCLAAREAQQGKELLDRTAAMLTALIRSVANRMAEGGQVYDLAALAEFEGHGEGQGEGESERESECESESEGERESECESESEGETCPPAVRRGESEGE